MEENIYVRKDVYDAQQDHILSLIENLDKRIDDLNNSINRQFSVLNIVFMATQIGLAIVFFFLTR